MEDDGDNKDSTTGSGKVLLDPTTTTTITTQEQLDTFQKTQAQLEAIEKEIKENQPLTSHSMDIVSLRSEYDKDHSASTKSSSSSSFFFELGINELAEKYSAIRKTRGDGNCYYRSFLYSLSEALLSTPENDNNERVRILQYVKDSMAFVTSVGGYDEMAVDIFYESLVEFVEGLTTPDAMHTELTQENSTSDYCTWYLRVLTATFLKADPTRFEPFLEDGYYDIATFCQQQIEPMGKECTMVQVLALAEAFQVKVEIEYLDGREFTPKVQGGNGLTMHSFGPDTSPTTLRLLYRPGHYDILYSK